MDSEIERLRKCLAKAEALALEERRRRKEEQRRREEEQQRREEEQQRREEEQQRREEEQQRREVAEELLQPQTLESYLESCHRLSLAIKPVTDRSLTTQGETTNPTGRIYPRRIVPWEDFPAKQEIIWQQLYESSFASQPLFPSQHQLDYVRSFIGDISSEQSLRHFERETVENAVQRLINTVYEDPLLRNRFGLRGTVTFESHTNLRVTDNLSEPLNHTSPAEGGAENDALRKRHRPKKRGKGNLADQFCICRTSDGANVPVIAIEYKAPHKLSVDEVVTGLHSEIQPDRDVIHKEGEGFDFAAKVLAAAVVTQLFSYMIGKGLQYGYVCTGEAFVFLYVADDPRTVLYHISVPNKDVIEDDENRLHRTATAQVFAFILQALQTAPLPQSWYTLAETGLDIWDVEFDDVLSKIPVSVRKGKERQASPYKPQRWKGFCRSPIRTRSSCKEFDAEFGLRDNGDDEEDASPSPTLGRSTRSENNTTRRNESTSTEPRISGEGEGKGKGQRKGQERQALQYLRQGGIQDLPYCTHQCLLGLVYGRPLDNSCPNAANHGHKHISVDKFRDLLRAQLAIDRGRDADCIPLYLSGATGSLFKVRLSTCGYTLVAKGVEEAYVEQLQHENTIYDALQSIQGKHIPVCLGLIDLILPYYYNGGIFKHFLLLSWAGRPLSRCIDEINETVAMKAIKEAFTKMHQLRVLHGDAEPRNILYDAINKTFMVADFGAAKFCPCQPLNPISANGLGRKRKLGQKQEMDNFTRELVGVSRCLSKVLSPSQDSASRRL